jgi:electron transport complex protein RnfB
MTDQQVYTRLREFMDQLPTGFPETPSGVEIKILRKLFTTEEAELFMKLKMEPEDVESISRRLGENAVDLAPRLEEMAQKGLLFRTYKGETVCYQAFQFLIGLYEFQLNTIDREFAELAEEYIPHYGLSMALAGVKTQQLRVAPVQSSIDPSSSVAPYNQIREMVRGQEVIAVSPCLCKKEQELLGHPCDRPLEVCLAFGSFARYYIDNGFGRRIDESEAIAVLDKAEEAGLVLSPSNTQELAAICCCCPCCCPSLRFGRLARQPRKTFRTEYMAAIDASLCSACGTCLDRCPIEAIDDSGDVMSVREERCIGCGLCVASCPEAAISLTHLPIEEAPPATFDDTFEQIRRERGISAPS